MLFGCGVAWLEAGPSMSILGNSFLRKRLFEVLDKEGSTYRKSLSEIFNPYFEPPK